MQSSFVRRARAPLALSLLLSLGAMSAGAFAQGNPQKEGPAAASPAPPPEPSVPPADEPPAPETGGPKTNAVAVSPGASTTPGSCVPPYPPEPPAPEPEKEPDPYHRDHFEVTMGFLVGQRAYSKSRFEFDDGNAESIGGGQLVEPFEKPPFDKVMVLGLRYDMRLVISYIRLLAGFDFPFPSYRTQDATAKYMVQGMEREVTVQSLSAKELRFGLGAEYPYKSIAVFADLIGGVHWTSAEFAIDGLKANYSATDFAFSGRGGIRLHVRPWFFASVAGEVGIIGDIVWNGDMSVGFAFP